jgi:hypothetical protein
MERIWTRLAQWSKIGPKQGSSPFAVGLALAIALFTGGAVLPEGAEIGESRVEAETLRADLIINIPVIIPGYPVILIPQQEVEETVTVRFIAEGNDWATIYLDDRILFRALNTRRNYAVELEPGAYRLQITGTTRFDEWGAGYLDVGRDDANLVVVRYSKTSGIRVSGDPFAWIPE